ncbi:MAG: CDP-alcohol phosphatidyltransferase family protein [Rikenellaceae bacterium]|nr:CDP-alcohol phosphatidyltransferase family protein [Rikenellaceae bacterium]
MQLKRAIPNIISVLRIILSFGLLLTLDNKYLFSGLVLFIGLTDIADGYFARKYNSVSKFGAKLDSLGDLFFFGIIIFILFYRYKWILAENYIWFLVIILLKTSTAVISKIKTGEFLFIHTIANKFTGLVVFLVAAIAAAEELGIVILNKTPYINQKSIFKKPYK